MLPRTLKGSCALRRKEGFAAVPTLGSKLVPDNATAHVSAKSPERIWHAALDLLQADLPKASFDTWIAPAQPLAFDGNTFTRAPDKELAYYQRWRAAYDQQRRFL